MVNGWFMSKTNKQIAQDINTELLSGKKKGWIRASKFITARAKCGIEYSWPNAAWLEYKRLTEVRPFTRSSFTGRLTNPNWSTQEAIDGLANENPRMTRKRTADKNSVSDIDKKTLIDNHLLGAWV